MMADRVGRDVHYQTESNKYFTTMKYQDDSAKNYETAPKFVKVMPKIA